MNAPRLICSQIPGDIPSLQEKRLPPVRIIAYLYGGLALILATLAFFVPMLLFLAGCFGLLCLGLLNWIRRFLRLCNTVEFYDDRIILRNHQDNIIRTVNFDSVLYADTVTLQFSYRPRVYGKCLCLWLQETPPIFQDDAFNELIKWEELFLFSYNEKAETLLREKIRFEQA